VNSSPGKILVIRGGAIGDFILTLPVLSALRSQFPQTAIELLGYAHIADLARAGGMVERVRSIEARPLAGFFARAGKLDAELADYFSGFALIISYLYDPDGIFQENVGRCTEAQFIAGPHRPNEAENLHATSVFLKPLERLAIFDADPVPRLRIGPAKVAGSNGSPRIRIAAHPGSGGERKNWPEQNWAALLQQLLQTAPAQLVLIGGEAEGERLARLSADLPRERVELLQRRPLTEVAQALQSCRAFIGHDSGISHLAAAVGMPGVILWGPSTEGVWRPMGERVKVLREPGGLHALAPDRVAGELRQLISEA
jgi:heptosyltransferase III